MKIPSTEDCFALIGRMAMLGHIAAHSIRVCQVAMLIGERLTVNGIALNLPLIKAAAMLHDITKTRSFETGENHAETGERYLRDLGYPEVGEIVGQHVRLRVYADVGVPTEAEVVNYADKRVLHDQVVPLSMRMDYILERYGGKNNLMAEKIIWIRDQTILMEKKLFSFMDFSSDQLSEKVIEQAILFDRLGAE